MGNREQITRRIPRRLMSPPPAIGASAKSDQVGSSLSLANNLPSSFCQQLVQCQRTGSVSFGGPVGIAEVSAFTFIDQIYRFLSCIPAISSHQRFSFIEVKFGKAIDDIVIFLVVGIICRPGSVLMEPGTTILLTSVHSSFTRFTFTIPADGVHIFERLSGVLFCTHAGYIRSEEHTSELQSRGHLVCRLLL